ncbi:protein translocase subunit SecF [Candidatus Gracilibacteria bacterium]|nr:protein translocase subunit SecF [Candidatus Gracilibacteria bacterium]MCF7819535.1 protein translocase subunit SecF [Candidatus Gracilibacteria bacterium]
MIHFTRSRNIWFTFSGILVAASIAAIAIFGFQLGLDFTGGARWEVDFMEKPLPRERVENFFQDLEDISQKPQIKTTAEQHYLITIEDMSDEKLQTISDKMYEQVGEFEEISYRKVDSSVGESFQKKAIYAIVVALIGIVIFVAFAFRKIPKAINPWRFGAVAIVALFHDVLFIVGVFVTLGYFTGLELDLAFITALLATLGFSVNDTIVILDRVRENIRLQKASETFEDSVEKSIEQTLARSINTSASTLFPLLALLIWGADAIFYFVLALTIGIAIGTYSSIFLAAPMLVSLKEWSDRRG